MPNLGPTEMVIIIILVLFSLAVTILLVLGGAVVVVRLLFGWRTRDASGPTPEAKRTGPRRTVTVNRRTHDR